MTNWPRRLEGQYCDVGYLFKRGGVYDDIVELIADFKDSAMGPGVNISSQTGNGTAKKEACDVFGESQCFLDCPGSQRNLMFDLAGTSTFGERCGSCQIVL